MPEACFGVDWGTHSSKWCYQDLRHRRYVGRIWDSTVWHASEALAIYPMELRYRGESGEAELKRKLIRDPDQPFWEGERRKLGATLGEAVVFSLYALLCDANTSLTANGIKLSDLDVSVRFSHPNWVTAETVTALQYYRDAAVVALSAFRESAEKIAPDGGVQISISQLRELITHHKKRLASLKPLPLLYDHKEYRQCLQGRIENIEWEFVFESCAAGLPYLVQAEPEVFDGEAAAYADHQWVRKILVIDIGAGSTDSGYMLRTIQRDPRTHKPVKPLLIWLPAAPALERAGNWLTDRILQEWVKEGRPAKTRSEAEDYKTSGVTDWFEKPFVVEWYRSITDHAAHYIRTVPDKIRLPKEPPLQLVVTGGSSAVRPIMQHLLDGIRRALQERGIGIQLSNMTSLIESSASESLGIGYSDIQYAQLAVALGASHPRMTELKHYPEGL